MDAFRFFLTDLVAVLGLYDKVLVAGVASVAPEAVPT